MKSLRLILMLCLIPFASIFCNEEDGLDVSLGRFQNWQKKVSEYCKPTSHVIREVFQGRTLFRESHDWIKTIHKDGAHETIAFAKRVIGTIQPLVHICMP